ncbi:methylisocitrate lyase [Escherichia coli]|nr:methylisocitrate lyase [Escherichia coli]EFQ5431731.1 methylisocitrate lyase [Escherichia coli]EHI6400313.1 methylisocitrate lyase [Escherichia coli]QKM97709.1 methylisocitrate lyase [Escherichia coli]
MYLHSPGKAFRAALSKENPLQIVGTINANHALLAQRAGYQAIYLSGGGVAAGSLGLPDLGISTLDDVLTDIRRITDVCSLPLLVDADIGFGSSAFNVARTVKSMIKAGAAGLHIEDQVGAKRCGHRPNKAIVSKEEMVDRIRAAVDAKTDPDFVIMARTDALAVEGLDAAIERAQAYVEAGAEMLFPEAITELAMYRQFADAVQVPILANITGMSSKTLSVINGIIGTVCALWLYNNFVGWLTFLSAAIPPVGGVIIADYLMNRRRYEHFATTRMMSVNWVAILAVALGIAAGHWLPGIVPVNAVLGGALSYLILNPILNRKTTAAMTHVEANSVE